jgi:hypothetical protein
VPLVGAFALRRRLIEDRELGVVAVFRNEGRRTDRPELAGFCSSGPIRWPRKKTTPCSMSADVTAAIAAGSSGSERSSPEISAPTTAVTA